MLTNRVARPAARRQVTPSPASREEHLNHAAWHLYALVKPEDGLGWWELTDQQRERFKGLIRLAARASDLTAVRAAHEACAAVLATQDDESLRDLPPVMRSTHRVKALNLCLTWERVLTTGTPETDERILALVREEHEVAARLNPSLRRPS